MKTQIKKSYSRSTLISLLLIISPFIAHSFILGYEKELKQLSVALPLTVINTYKMGKNNENNIIFLKDAHNQKFVLKEQIDPECAIHEKVGCDIGKHHININKVAVFPQNHPFTKQYTNKTATLHTFVPGTIAAQSNEKFHSDGFIGGITNSLQLQDLICSEDKKKIKKDLCDIIALDLYICNPDRHLHNFSVVTNGSKASHFYAFDMDYIYPILYNIANNHDQVINITSETTQSLLKWLIYISTCCSKTHTFLNQLSQNNISSEEIKVLKRINKMLGKFIIAYPPHVVYQKWMNTAQKVGYTYHPIKKELIRYLIGYNYDTAQKLHIKINSIIHNQSHSISTHSNNMLHHTMQLTQDTIAKGRDMFHTIKTHARALTFITKLFLIKNNINICS